MKKAPWWDLPNRLVDWWGSRSSASRNNQGERNPGKRGYTHSRWLIGVLLIIVAAVAGTVGFVVSGGLDTDEEATTATTIAATDAFDTCITDVLTSWGKSTETANKDSIDTAGEWCGGTRVLFRFQRGARYQMRDGEWRVVGGW